MLRDGYTIYEALCGLVVIRAAGSSALALWSGHGRGRFLVECAAGHKYPIPKTDSSGDWGRFGGLCIGF